MTNHDNQSQDVNRTDPPISLTDFLLARIAEDEAVAVEFRDCEFSGVDAWGDGADLFFGDNAPASTSRVLAECETKRRIAEREADDIGLPEHRVYTAALAAIYADHPDYREQEWKP